MVTIYLLTLNVAWEKITYNDRVLLSGREFEKQMFNLKQNINIETNVQGLDVSPNDAKRVLPAVHIDGDGQVLDEGDRVYSYGYDDNWKPQRLYGTLHKNEDFPEVSEWYIAYDDGQECAVLEMSLVFKA